MGSTVRLYLDDECVGKMQHVDSWWIEYDDAD